METKIITIEDIGTYGCKWIRWMEEHHKGKVRKMKSEGVYLAVAKSVDDEAWDYRELLDRQYEEANLRPTEFEEAVAWERTMAFYTNSAVMREVVLIPITQVCYKSSK